MTEQPPALPDWKQLPEALVASARLFEARTILLFGEISSAVSERVSSQLLALAARERGPIRMFVHSPGGHVEAADSIFDIIRYIEPEVTVVGSGWVASAGALIYCAVPRERRLALPNTRFMLHEPSGGFGGQAADIEIEARQVVAMRARLNATFAEATGQSLEAIARDTERNHWLTAREALGYGLVGRIVERASEV
jgi:ATP-dependent Clp protease protease subunit